MRKDDLLLLHQYNQWATERLLSATSALSPDEFAAPTSFPWGSIRGTLQHMLRSEWLWRILAEEGAVPEPIREFQECETVDALRETWATERAGWRRFLESLTEAQIEADFAYTLPNGAIRTQPMWLALTHVVNHGTQHRAEVAQMLTDLGHSPGDLDLSYWYRIQQGLAT